MAGPKALAVDVCFLPRDLEPRHIIGRAVVAFDVLRATTSITAALHAGVRSIRIFPTAADVTNAKREYPAALLCGEERCLPPPGFDLGNSPGAFSPLIHTGRDLLMSTTNGTRAILAAAGAARLYAAALINAAAVARQLGQQDLPVTLLCAGTGGAIALEDILGAGAVIASLKEMVTPQYESDCAQIADRFFAAACNALPSTLRTARGGYNLIQAGLDNDIDFCARLNTTDTVGIVSDQFPPVITAL